MKIPLQFPHILNEIASKNFVQSPDFFGEVLRAFSFVSPVGCYTCFELLPRFEEIKNPKIKKEYLKRIFPSFDEEEIEEDLKFFNLFFHPKYNLFVGWVWDGDGTLYFKLEDKHTTIEVMNTDCKKDYGWFYID
jgi:hypothetical protein